MSSSWLSTIHHDGSARYVSEPWPRLGDVVRIRLRVGVGAPVRRVFLRTCADTLPLFTPMRPAGVEPPAQWFEAELPIQRTVTSYRFVLEGDDGVWSYAAAGPTPHAPLDGADFRLVTDAPVPDWLQSAVLYQVVLDRFANGDPSRDPRPEDYDAEDYHYREYEYRGQRPRTLRWGEAPPDGQAFPLVFYGGDLPGLEQRLAHLEALGVTALALTPIFTSPSNHRYDAADHHHVDPRLGGDEALARLRQALTARGLRYLLEIDFAQLSWAHPWFRAARRDEHAPEVEFFTFGPHAEAYDRWLGLGSLRRLNYRSEELVRRMITGPESVLRRWLKPPYAADGWTVHLPQIPDRPYEPGDIGHAVRRTVQETRPDACVMSRSAVDAAHRLQGDQLDGVADLGSFTMPLWHWLRGYREEGRGLDEPLASPGPWPTTALDAAWQAARAAIPWTTFVHQAVMIDGHDLPRIRTVVKGNDALHRLAAVVQFTYPGVPTVYYGDEIGMEDVPGVGQRGCMIWDEARWDAGLLAFYRSLVALRRASAVLQEGGFQVLATEPDTLVYQREGADGRVVVVAHRGARPRPARPVAVDHGGIPDGTTFVEHFSRQAATVRAGLLPLPELAQGGTIWVMSTPVPGPHAAHRRRGRRDLPASRAKRAPKCPSCGRQDGSRLASHLGAARAPEHEQRWVCLWCGSLWKREPGGPQA